MCVGNEASHFAFLLIVCLTSRAYADMPLLVQCELVRDQFIQALLHRELRVQTQLAQPQTTHDGLEPDPGEGSGAARLPVD